MHRMRRRPRRRNNLALPRVSLARRPAHAHPSLGPRAPWGATALCTDLEGGIERVTVSLRAAPRVPVVVRRLGGAR